MESQNENAIVASTLGLTANGPPDLTVTLTPTLSMMTTNSTTMTTTLTTTMSATKAQPAVSSIPSQSQEQQHQQPYTIGPFDEFNEITSNTLKRNQKMEWRKIDLLRTVACLEAELQAREITIAVLKSEKMKYLLNSKCLSGTADPHAALARDGLLSGGVIGSDRSQVDQQHDSLEALRMEQTFLKYRMALVLKDAENRHKAVIKELEEEKRKHEHDTAQGDDITYGLEKERTRLKTELELEKQEKKRLEQELKKVTDSLEEERNRQKQIVLLLLAERKKIILKYVEERKRSEDLAQILSEEKVRIDSMAEGLEEESKKSLQMEAELEKQLAQFDIERQQYRQALAKEEKRVKDLELELEKTKAELQTRGSVRAVGVTPPPPPAKPANLVAMPTLRPASASQNIKGTVLGTGTPMVSSKVVQPTATVSSVPVSGPTTGIARSVTPGQALRGVAYTPTLPASGTEPSATTESQGLEKRTAVPTANPSPVQSATSKVAATAQQPSGKLLLSSSQATSQPQQGQGQAAVTTKKPGALRGVPPPVPPNKPVVPPKKEAAYLRRPDLPQSSQDAVKLSKQPSAQSPSAAVTNMQTGSLQPQAPQQNFQSSNEEAKPR